MRTMLDTPRCTQAGPAHQPCSRYAVTVAGMPVGQLHQVRGGWNATTPRGDRRTGFASQLDAAQWLAEQELGR